MNRDTGPFGIVVRGLTKRFGKVTAVDGISFAVPRGEFFGFLGPNGAGKSTTIKAVIGLLPAVFEEVTVAGVDLRRDPVGLKRRIGVMLEEPNLYDRLTAREYLTFAGRMYGLGSPDLERRVADLLDLTELTEAEGKMIVDFSMGMRKKVALAAAIIHDPDVLFLDEPFNGIDPISSKRIKDVLHKMLSLGRTIFFSSHVLEVVEKLCTSLAIIDAGRIVYQNTMAALREQQEGKSLEEIFVEKVGEKRLASADLNWLN